MAEAPDPVEKELEELEKEITCPVCKEHFRDPKILPCLHYYCKECLRELTLRAGSNRPFKCPVCERGTVLPEDDPDQLPTAFFIDRMKELRTKMEKEQGRVEAMCEMCCRAKAEAFCHQCAEFICGDCVRLHGVLRIFTGHKVVTLEELKEGGAKTITLKDPPPLTCEDHDERMKIYCFDCTCLICRDCIIRDHTGHAFEFVKKSAPQYKKILKENLVQIKGNISDAAREIEMVEREVSQQHESTTGRMKQSFRQLHEILYQREKELLDKAFEFKQQKLELLGAQKEGFVPTTHEIEGLMTFLGRSAENSPDEEFMALQPHIQKEIQKYEHINLVPAEIANVSVRMICGEDISNLCQKDADVIILADPTKCVAEGPGTQVAEVGKLAQFTVSTMNQKGQLCREEQAIEAKVKSVVNDSVIHAKVTSKERGVCEVTYTPEARGRHAVIVQVNGTQIARSPFCVFAKIHPTLLGEPVNVMEGVMLPFGIALNSKQQLVVSEWGGNKVTVFDKDGKKVQTITSEKCYCPDGLTVDQDDQIYVSCGNSLFKFNREGKPIKVVRQHGTQPGEFSDLGLIKVINDKVYVCDCGNHRVQILNTNLEYMNTFGCYGDGDGQFNRPTDIAQDRAGNLYVTDSRNHCVQVFTVFLLQRCCAPGMIAILHLCYMF